MITIDLYNKERLLLVDVPEEIKFKISGLGYLCQLNNSAWEVFNPIVQGDLFILGGYYPTKNKVDFEPQQEWVEYHSVQGYGGGYKNYVHQKEIGGEENFKKDYLLHGDHKISFLSLLESHTINNSAEKYLVILQK